MMSQIIQHDVIMPTEMSDCFETLQTFLPCCSDRIDRDLQKYRLLQMLFTYRRQTTWSQNCFSAWCPQCQDCQDFRKYCKMSGKTSGFWDFSPKCQNCQDFQLCTAILLVRHTFCKGCSYKNCYLHLQK